PPCPPHPLLANHDAAECAVADTSMSMSFGIKVSVLSTKNCIEAGYVALRQHQPPLWRTELAITSPLLRPEIAILSRLVVSRSQHLQGRGCCARSPLRQLLAWKSSGPY